MLGDPRRDGTPPVREGGKKRRRTVSFAMAIRNPSELKEIAVQGRRFLGIDVGTKTLGLAISDPTHIVATPLITIRRSRFSADIEKLRRIIEERDVGALVIGLPINMDGSEGQRCRAVRRFAENLLACIDINIAFFDERLSTVAVTRTLLEANVSRRRRAEVVDKMAAAYILQGALDRIRSAE